MIVSGSSRLLRTAVPPRSAAPSCAGCVPSSRRSAHKLVAVQLLSDSLPSLGARNQVVALSPGLARNRLVPAGLAVYVGRDGEGVSVRRDMERRGEMIALRRREGQQQAARRAKGVLEQLAQGNAPPTDPLAAARAAERALSLSLSTLAPPSSPLIFTRLTTSPTSSDLFGSVSVADVVSALRERGVVGLATSSSSSSSSASGASSGSGAGEGAGAHGAFRSDQVGVLNGRVKQVGEYVFEVELRASGERVPVQVEVRREDK
ncbi:hypothetical protein JCM3775_001474 [Rhodotorula graminis]